MLRYHGLLLLNKHSDIFLLHNFGLQIIPFEMEKLKKVYNQSEKKKDNAKTVYEVCCSRIQIMILKATT